MCHNLSFEATRCFHFKEKDDELCYCPEDIIEGKIKILMPNPNDENKSIVIGEISCTCYSMKKFNFDPTMRYFIKASANSTLREVMCQNKDKEVYYNIFADCYDKMMALVGNDDIWYIERIEDCDIGGYLIVLNNVYIDPLYSNEGIISYIYKKIGSIIRYSYELTPYFTVGICPVNDTCSFPMNEENILLDNGYTLFNFNDALAFYKYILD